MSLTKQQTIKWFRIINWKNKMLDKLSKISRDNWKKQKKYQYLLLKEKINHRNTKDEYSNLNTEYWDEIGSGMCEEQRTECDEANEKSEERTSHLKQWLDKINKKYKYA